MNNSEWRLRREREIMFMCALTSILLAALQSSSSLTIPSSALEKQRLLAAIGFFFPLDY